MDLGRLERQARSLRLPRVRTEGDLRPGRHRSRRAGHGFVIADTREYQYGDDIRNLDWNVTARLGKPYVKVFEQDPGAGVLLVLDLSASVRAGTAGARKSALMREIAVLLALAARHHGERLGAILVTGRVERIVAPRRGQDHADAVIRELMAWQPAGDATSLAAGLQAGRQVMGRPGLAIVLSDFLDRDYEPALAALMTRHRILALCIKDPAEMELPRAGLVTFRDPESGAVRLLDTNHAAVRRAYERRWTEADARRLAIMRRLGVPAVDVPVGRPYLHLLNSVAASRPVR